MNEKYSYWLDCNDALSKLSGLLKKNVISDNQYKFCHQWINEGYIIVKNHFSHSELDLAWSEYDDKIKSKLIIPPDEVSDFNDPYPARTLNPHFHVEGFREIMGCSNLLDIINLLLGIKPIPFQSIASHKGSQQKLHSDAIHMTTNPLGGLVAAWVAFEDISIDSGPLVFCPTSHKLPYLLSKELSIDSNDFKVTGYTSYHQKYEPKIESIVNENNLKKEHFLAQKGDVLIWHHNLIHGGSLRNDYSISRKALVAHYFDTKCHCYHDLSGDDADLLNSMNLFK